MIISIWRYSHFTLAVSSSLFLLIATLTGVVLAFEPIENQFSNDFSMKVHAITIDETIRNLQQESREIISVEVQTNKSVIANFIDHKGDLVAAFVNPRTGEVIGTPEKRAFVYQFSTSLHRSLFLKKTGRFFVGFTSFLLFLISVSGFILILKRQGGIKKIFSKIIDNRLYQYLHVVFGKLAIIPIVIVTLSGVFLSLDRFDVIPMVQNNIPENNLSTEEISQKKVPNFFQATTLDAVKTIEFPFSDDADEFYKIYLDDSEVEVHQKSGVIISRLEYPFIKIIAYYSFILHTGTGNFWWSLVLLFTSISILYFMYSGVKISIDRRRNSKNIKNFYAKDDAEYLVLYGSEKGTTFGYAKEFYRALVENNKMAFLDQLNNFSNYKKANHLVIFTATYGEGAPPSNAKKFLKLVVEQQLASKLSYSVVGFGAKQYPDYCQFAMDINQSLQNLNGFEENTGLHKINNNSHDSFSAWLSSWNENNNLNLEVAKPKNQIQDTNVEMSIVSRTQINLDDTYIVQLKPSRKLKFKSGDLIGITPKDQRIRYYSISKCNNQLLLSIKKHEFGVVSNYLYTSKLNTSIGTCCIKKTEFHFSNRSKHTILIANGTGIAPFLGMISAIKNKNSVYMFLGLRTKQSMDVYKPILKEQNLRKLSIAYSQGYKKQYVQDIIELEKDLIVKLLSMDVSILICGSVQMGNGVLKVLDKICLENYGYNTTRLLQSGQLKMDCY